MKLVRLKRDGIDGAFVEYKTFFGRVKVRRVIRRKTGWWWFDIAEPVDCFHDGSIDKFMKMDIDELIINPQESDKKQ